MWMSIAIISLTQSSLLRSETVAKKCSLHGHSLSWDYLECHYCRNYEFNLSTEQTVCVSMILILQWMVELLQRSVTRRDRNWLNDDRGGGEEVMCMNQKMSVSIPIWIHSFTSSPPSLKPSKANQSGLVTLQMPDINRLKGIKVLIYQRKRTVRKIPD